MKNIIGITFILLLVLSIFISPQDLQAQGIIGSQHDFSSTGYGWTFMHGGSDEICIPCHTPHNADVTVIDAPLWNHQVTVAVFTPYSSSTLNATVGQPNGSSKLCLSCHDGTVALDSWGGQTGTVFWSSGHNDVMGTDLTDDHPISFTYDATLAFNDLELHDPTITNSGLGGTVSGDLLINNQLECSSCHDVHNEFGNNYLLRIDNIASSLCLTCHNK